jgi:microcystin-dependent protein
MVTAAVVLGATLSPRGADTPAPASLTPGVLPVGTILAFGGPASSVPEAGGWLLCDGRELAATQYPDLQAVLGSAWGEGRSGGTFRIPDLRGRFLRGVNYDATGDHRDPDRDQRGTSGPGGNSGNEVGSLQEDTAGPHQHPLSGAADAIGQGAGAEWVRFHANKVPDESAAVLSNTWSIQPPGPAETRPRNVYVNWIIRAR